MLSPFSGFSPEQVRALSTRNGRSADRREIAAQLRAAARRMGTDAFREKAARELVRALRPGEILPEAYADYRDIVSDGIGFLISRLSPPRVADLAAEQIAMPSDTPARQRLVALARSVPTLHKLGQTIARNRHLDPDLRTLLATLENSVGGDDPDAIRERVRREIGNYRVPYDIRMEREPLCEASVGAVIGFSWTAPDTGRPGRGVFKVLKPGVRANLSEEFEILDGLADFFEARRDRYSLREFRFRETFADVRAALEEEIRLRGEQDHLRRADRFYAGDDRVRVPALLPFCTDGVTAMERMPGGKLSDLARTPVERRDAARALFRALIWRPIFSREAKTPFHGDPHAGNIYAFRGEAGEILPVLLDWSLSDTLDRAQRVRMVRLVMGASLGDRVATAEALAALSTDTDRDRLDRIVAETPAEPAGNRSGRLGRAFEIIDRTAIRGVRFPRSLLLFRKAFFTLDGVLHDLDPEFDMDAAVAELAVEAFLREMPRRWIGGAFPGMDRPEQYATLVSNRDLAWLASRLLLEAGERGTRFLTGLAMEPAGILRRIAGPTFC